jgi:hypothetical protein
MAIPSYFFKKQQFSSEKFYGIKLIKVQFFPFITHVLTNYAVVFSIILDLLITHKLLT